MNKLVLGAVGAALIAVLALAGTSYTGGDVAHAQGQVNFDVDPDISGNSANTLGTVERCVRVDLGLPLSFDAATDVTIDIVVTGDTLAPTAYDASMTYDNTKVNTSAGTDPLIKLPGAMSLGDGAGDSDGTFSPGALYLAGGPGTPGNGTIVRVGLDLNLAAADDLVFGMNGSPLTAYASGAGTHPVTVDGAKLSINKDCPEDEVDLSVDSVITAAPTTLDASVDGTLTVTTTGTHTGGPLTDTVNATISHTVTAPAGCTVDGGASASDSWTGDLTSGSSHALVTDFTLHCSEPSTHTFVVDNEVVLNTAGYTDPVSGNNTDTENVVVTVYADADVGIVSMAAVCPRMIDSNADTVPDLCIAEVSTPETISIEKELHNNGPYGPVEVSNTKIATNLGMDPAPNDSYVDPAMDSEQSVLPVSIVVPVVESFDVVCDVYDAGQVVVFYFQNDLAIKTVHVDKIGAKDMTANVMLPVLCVPRFTPTFVATIDEDPLDGTMGAPADDICVLGDECKSLTAFTIPSDTPKQPLALIQTIAPVALTIAQGTTTTNGNVVGKSDFSVVAHVQGL
ncbi:MAG: hypothetical protein JSU97_04310, partial [Dehalococcoidia bacterium]